ncbi:helicase RepA family protein [Rhodobacter sp. SY28-1]|uniref:AAA family ATPase n=1 Tax=Rhodobacter sp. SY28-1 TaxID=2562317 RepID=UPI0010BF9E4B|nr:helicase RepA family protein [Rhodobacter sp. SY28-1]
MRPDHDFTDLENEYESEWMNYADPGGRKPGRTGRAFKLVRFADLQATEPDYLVEGLIERGNMVLIFGDPAAGKSFLTIDLGACVATGTNFHGRPTKAGAVIYIAGEGHSGLARRRMAWEADKGFALADRQAPLFVSTVAGNFLDTVTTEAVISEIKATVESEGPPVLIVVDTLARNFGGGDENSTSDMNRFIAAVDRVKDQWTGCSALIVHHTGHGNKTRSRGSFALTGAVDAEFRVEKDGMVMTVINTKMKDAPTPAPMAFDMVEMQLGQGMTSLALRETEVQKRASKVSGQAEIALQAFGDALADHGEKKVGESFPQNRQCVSLERWREYCDRHGISGSENPTTWRTAFHKAKNILHKKGIIRILDGYAWRVEG